MGDMLILESHIENMGLCKLIEQGLNGTWMAITLSGRTIHVTIENERAIEIRKKKKFFKKII